MGEHRGGDAPGQQRRPGPEQQRRQECGVAHRDRRHALRGEDDLIAAAYQPPEDDRCRGQQPEVQVEPGPQRPPGPADHLPRAAHRQAAGVLPRGNADGQGGEGQPSERRDRAPVDRLARRGAEPRGAEREPAGDHRAGQADGRAEHADQQRLGHGQPDDPARRGSPDAQQGLLAPPPVGARRADDAGDQRSKHGTRQAEEQEKQFRVQRVAAGSVQLRAQVVADKAGPRQPRFQILGAPHDVGEGRLGVAGQGGGQLHVVLDVCAGQPRAARRGVRPLPLCGGKQHHVVRGGLWGRARRHADRLEHRVRRGQVHDSLNPDVQGRQPLPSHADHRADGGVQVRRRLLGEQHPAVCPEQEPDLSGKGRGVARRQAEHLTGPGRLDRSCRGRGESRRRGIADRQALDHAGRGRDDVSR